MLVRYVTVGFTNAIWGIGMWLNMCVCVQGFIEDFLFLGGGRGNF